MTIRSLWRDLLDQTQATQTQLQFYAESCYASNSSRAFEGGSLAMFINMTYELFRSPKTSLADDASSASILSQKEYSHYRD